MTKKTMTRSENMARIRSKNTSIEIRLRKALWARGFRYRVNDKYNLTARMENLTSRMGKF